MTRLQHNFSRTQALMGLFILGFIVRSIPEILAYPYPISWDMLHYAYFMRTGIVWEHWSSFFTSPWLLYAFIFPIHNQFGVDSFLLLKVAGPVLFGFNVCGVYWFAKSLLNWGTKKSFLAGCLFSLQLASLRISSEFLKNTLGLGLLLFTLPLIKRLNSKRGFATFILFSLLTVFAHEYAAVTLLVISLVLVLSGLLNREEKRIRLAKKLIVAILPASIIFLAGVYLRIFPISYAHPPTVVPNLVWVNDTTSQTYGPLFFFVNYLGMNTGLDIYPNYLFLVLSVLALFALLYLPYFYLVWKGFFRNEIIDVWTGLLIVGSFGCLITPFFALDLWHRWMFMLVYPFTFYAVNGAEILFRRMPQHGTMLKKFRNFRNKISLMILATALLGAIYLATPFLMVHVGFGIYSLYPTSRYFSSAPAVPYQDINGTISAMQWLKGHMHNNSCAVLQNAFATWARLYLENPQNIIAYINDVKLAVDLALQKNYQKIYFVCWSNDTVWYGIYLPENFTRLQSFDRISVFEYVGDKVD
jgi:hypothetical protein